MYLKVGARTDTGRVRGHNEDSYLCEPELGLFAVCDGMGGEAAGEVASQLAVETMRSELTKVVDTRADSGGLLQRTQRLGSAVHLCNGVVYGQSQSNEHQKGMGTTVVSAWIADHIASLGHVGDSRVYLWRHRQLEQLTRDHSLVQEKIDAGLLTLEESLESTEKNIVTRALGRGPEVEVDLVEVPVIPGDYILLCTDGITGMVPDSALESTITDLREPQEICDNLVEHANRNGGVDNSTVVVVQILKERFWHRWFRAWRQKIDGGATDGEADT